MIALIIFHFIADFLFQPRLIAERKSSSLFHLSLHVFIFGFVFFLLSQQYFCNESSIEPLTNIMLNIVSHFFIDLCTSKTSAYFYKKKNMYMFWNTIGLDQCLHILMLFYLFGDLV